MKYKILTITALIGSAIAELFGGWDMALQTLVIFMAIDWITGGMIDRLVHHGHLLIFEGKSYRMEHALMRRDA